MGELVYRGCLILSNSLYKLSMYKIGGHITNALERDYCMYVDINAIVSFGLYPTSIICLNKTYFSK